MYAILFQYKRDYYRAKLVKSFRYIKGNTPNLNYNQKIFKFHKSLIKNGVWISRLKSRLIR